MIKNAPLTAPTYFDSVMTWGNKSPWKGLGYNLNHKVSFRPEEVVRDGQGNILKMPPLDRKPCFGRPETVFRHAKRTQKLKLPNGQIVDSIKHRCGSCPAGVHGACVQTAVERVKSDPSIYQALLAWRDYFYVHHNGERTYTGPASIFWVAFKQAVAARGPFQSSNDAEVAKLHLQKRMEQREKWTKKKRTQRQRERAHAKDSKQLPSEQFVINLNEERDRRFDALLEALGQSGQPPSRSRVQQDKREATAMITVNAWATRELQRASGNDVGPGTIARLMVENNLNAGTRLGTLKTRMPKDLKRADECEQDGLWKRFDPDADLNGYDAGDNDAADALTDPVPSIDRILWDLV
jgi:hypothetical protein